MEDQRLKVFISVARNKSLTRASHELHMTQSTISKYIQELEQEYGVMLLNRTNNGVELTASGEMLLNHAHNIMQQYRSMNFDLHMMSHEHSGELRLGASTTITQYILPTYMALFATKFKQIKLSLVSGNTHEIEDALLSNRIDIGLVESCQHKPHLRYTPFLHDEIVMIASTSSRWALCDSITMEELKGTPIVTDVKDSDIYRDITHSFNRNNIDLNEHNIVTFPGGYEAIKRYIYHTDFVALMPLQAILQEIKMGLLKVINIQDVRVGRELAFVRKMEETNSITKDFISYIQEELKHNI